MRERVLRWLRIPDRPAPPPGAGDSLRIFRASPRYLTVRRIQWVLTQFGGLVGILVSLAFLGAIDLPIPVAPPEPFPDVVAVIEPVASGVVRRLFGITLRGDQILMGIEAITIGGYLLQLVFSGFLVTLRWKTHWYMVSDESLRIREGLWKLREQTMTVANIQNMKIRQDPIQRFFGLAELEVHTAGGGGKTDDADGKTGNLHVGHFRGLDDAWALRDRLRLTLARRRSSGLGDPDDGSDTDRPDRADASALRDAANELLEETRRLSAALRRRPGASPGIR